MAEESNEEAAAVPEVVQTAREPPAGALLPSRSGVLPALPDDIPDADVPALLEDIERRVEALPGAFDAALARKQVVAGNAMAVAMQARNLRRVTDRALALIEARLAALMPANPPGRPPRSRPGNLTVNRQVPMPENLTACRRRRRCPPTRPTIPHSRWERRAGRPLHVPPATRSKNHDAKSNRHRSRRAARPRHTPPAARRQDDDASPNSKTARTIARVEQHDLCASSSTPRERLAPTRIEHRHRPRRAARPRHTPPTVRRKNDDASPNSNIVTAGVEQHDLCASSSTPQRTTIPHRPNSNIVTAGVEQDDLYMYLQQHAARTTTPSRTVTARVEQHDLDTRLQQHAVRTTTPARTRRPPAPPPASSSTTPLHALPAARRKNDDASSNSESRSSRSPTLCRNGSSSAPARRAAQMAPANAAAGRTSRALKKELPNGFVHEVVNVVERHAGQLRMRGLIHPRRASRRIQQKRLPRRTAERAAQTRVQRPHPACWGSATTTCSTPTTFEKPGSWTSIQPHCARRILRSP